MKKSRIIAPALGVLILSTAASITGTVAWFTANNTVQVSGMQVKTKVGSNLLIAAVNEDANFTGELNQSVKGILEPVSTVNGEDFFYTTNAKANGDAAEDKYTAYDPTGIGAATDTTNYANKFSEEYGVTKDGAAELISTLDRAVGYVDYSFYLRAASTAENQKLVMSTCNLTYNDLAITSGFAWRVAVFAQATSANTTVEDATCVASANKLSILDMLKSRNQNEVSAVVPAAETNVADGTYWSDANLQTAATGTANGTTTYYQKTSDGTSNAAKAVSATNAAPTAVTYNTEVVVDSDVDVEVSYYKVVVRLWLEGEDVTCTSDTYAALNLLWKLNLEFKLGAAASTDGVTVIGSADLPVEP